MDARPAPQFALAGISLCLRHCHHGSEAIGRAKYLGTKAAWCVAAGAISFMASDSILAIDKFVTAVPAAYLWVLGTYYLAQWLIVHGMVSALRERHS